MLINSITNRKFCINANGPLELSPKKKVNMVSANKNSNPFFFENSSISTDKIAAAIKPPITPNIITEKIDAKTILYLKKL
tara:strand:- start:2610 stop:2849 length:240 start_codon:yes stop_codon:yes gene_type:complete